MIKSTTFLLCSVFCLLIILGVGCEEKVSKRERNPKWMNGYFPFVKLVIPPEPCGTISSTPGNEVRDGVCVPRGKCEVLKGSKNGDCAKGFGECCKFTAMCNASYHEVIINEEVITLNTQTPLDTDCTFEIRRKPKYCAVKLDFVQYMSTSADLNGTCTNDSITIRGSSTVPEGFQTCGRLNGQHMHLTFGKSGTIEVIPSYSSMSGGGYQIVATQIPCVSPLRVPEQCLQYYNASKGVVKSFDFPNRQQSNQEYTVCVGGMSNAASITWKPCSTSNAGGQESPFSISNGNPGFGNWTCRNERDWVQVNGQNQVCKLRDFPPAGIRSNFSPFLLNVHFNELEKRPLPCYEDVISLPISDCINNGVVPGTPNACINANYESCVWDDVANSCSCSPTPLVWEMLEGDVLNTGFCLEYTQNTRRL